MSTTMETDVRNFREYVTDGHFNKELVLEYGKTVEGLNRHARAALVNRLWAFFQEVVQTQRVPLMLQCFYCGTVDNAFPCPHAIGSLHSVEYVGCESAIGILPRLEPVNLMGINSDYASEVAAFIRWLQQ